MGSEVDTGGYFAFEIPIETNSLTRDKQSMLSATTGFY